MVKNFIIVALILLCSYIMLVQPAGVELIQPEKAPQPSEHKARNDKIPHSELINTTSVHGLSLNTPIETIDSIIAKTPFTCRTSTRQSQDKDGQTHQEKFWRCSHKTLRMAEIRIDVRDNKIQRLSRSGPSSQEHINNALEQLLQIRSKLENFKNFSMSQSERSTAFNLQHREDGKILSSMTFGIQILPQERMDEKSSDKYKGMLNISLSRQ